MEDKKNFIINVLYFGLIGVVIYLASKYIVPNIMPFIVAFLIAYLAIKLCNLIFKKHDDKLHRAICLLLIYIIVVGLLVVLTINVVNKLTEFFAAAPTLYGKYVEPSLMYIEKLLNDLNDSLPLDVRNVINNSIDGIFDSLKSIVLSASTVLVKGLTSVVTAAPDALISVIVTIISSFYFCFDYEDIATYFKTKLPKKYSELLIDVKIFCESNVFKVAGSYIIMMLMTMVELFIGFCIIGVQNAGVLALIISIVDVLPVLGVGTVLIPWGIVAIIYGDVAIGIEILVLYLIITFIRNIVESKFVGGNLGLHPLATLIAMIVGLRLFGLVGLFLVPLAISFIITRRKKQA